MRVDNTNIYTSSQSREVSNSATNPKAKIELGKLLTSGAYNSNTDKTIKGTNASVTIARQDGISVPGFNTQKLNIKTADGEYFTIDLHISNNCINENTELTERLSKILSNLPSDALKDLKEECKHILIPKNIIYNKEAKGLAIGPLNQIFLSADRIKDMSNQEVSETLVHELGHLVDYHSSSLGKGEATNSYKREFNNLKEHISKDLGFDENAHTFKEANELFADYYLYNKMQVSDKHRSKPIFDLLNTYKKDIETLSPNELQEKYKDKTEDIIALNKSWQNIEKQFKYYLGNLEDPEIVDRMNENALPMNFEQLDSMINKKK